MSCAMKDDYKLQGSTAKIEAEVEKAVAEQIQVMAKYTKHSASELVNTALKRFISQHKDIFPSDYKA